ncbi:nuclease [Dehalococcoides mccartyi]|uniref:DNA double-strand break repair nuclease NurA n=1 Tax=Dehalococcoides mccartyi TaxID=61435 RepID=UPI00098EA2CC|nr:DNA double-strand break repair nuclease NurA [Dehalococcoides mccartyi]AQU05436.1 nuclease [Dehalococcoides mccartyi]AQU06881.1 nuclease [Dehalococcoides mccartyi]
MSLNLDKTALQIQDMVSELKGRDLEHQKHLQACLDGMARTPAEYQRLLDKVERSKTTFLLARPAEIPNAVHQPPVLPQSYRILATDGSQIDVDRHQLSRCYLINIGRVQLEYGKAPSASLESLPVLYARPEDMVISCGSKELAVEGTLLGIKRSVEETRHLSEMADATAPGLPTLALGDGTLILWSLLSKEFPEYVVENLLVDGYLKYLEQIKNLNTKDRQVALASYISYPRSTDVVNTLRLLYCPYEPANCISKCDQLANGKRPCDILSGITDSMLFDRILKPGERSALFASSSSILEKYYGEHRVYFYYLKTSEEIARVELPAWTVHCAELLNLSHSLILEQCRLGHGYPVSLSEAHEQAVVSGQDRRIFNQLVEEMLTASQINPSNSAKSLSKKTRWV